MLWGCKALLLSNHTLEVAMGQLAIYRMVWQPLNTCRIFRMWLCVRAKLKRWLVL